MSTCPTCLGDHLRGEPHFEPTLFEHRVQVAIDGITVNQQLSLLAIAKRHPPSPADVTPLFQSGLIVLGAKHWLVKPGLGRAVVRKLRADGAQP